MVEPHPSWGDRLHLGGARAQLKARTENNAVPAAITMRSATTRRACHFTGMNVDLLIIKRPTLSVRIVSEFWDDCGQGIVAGQRPALRSLRAVITCRIADGPQVAS